MGTGRAPATVNNTNNAHYAFVNVTGLDAGVYQVSSIRGLLLFPDNAIISVDNTQDDVSLTTFDDASATGTNTIPLSVMRTLESNGCIFLPMAGCYDDRNNKGVTKGWFDLNEGGYYWSRTNYSSAYAYALALTYDNSAYSLAPVNCYDAKAIAYFPILLIQL